VQRAARELLADYRCSFEQELLIRRKAIKTCGQERLDHVDSNLVVGLDDRLLVVGTGDQLDKVGTIK